MTTPIFKFAALVAAPALLLGCRDESDDTHVGPFDASASATPPGLGEIIPSGYQNATLGMATGFGEGWESLSGMVEVDTIFTSGGALASATGLAGC